MKKQVIHSDKAPAAIGPYSAAIRSGNIVYLSGQLPLDPDTMSLVTGIEAQAEQVFKNISAVVGASGGDLQEIVKLTIFLQDLNDFEVVNRAMSRWFTAPYPARSTIQVAGLPKGALVEIEGILVLGE